MKNSYIFQNQNLQHWYCFTFLQNFLLSGLIESCWTVVSAINLLHYHTSHKPWKTLSYIRKSIKLKKANNALVYEYSFDLTNKLKGSCKLPEVPELHFKRHCHEKTNIVYSFPGTEKHYVKSHRKMRTQT